MLYRLYPTLLNSFSLYLSQSRDSSGKIIVDEIELIERINRTKKPTTKAQQKARARFENNKTQLDAFLQNRGVLPLTPSYDEILNGYTVSEFGSCR